MTKYVRNCDWCDIELIDIENHTSNKFTCSNPTCPHDHGGYIRCDDEYECRRRVCKCPADTRRLNDIPARQFILPKK